MHKHYKKFFQHYLSSSLFSLTSLFILSNLLITNSFAQQSVTGVYQNYTGFQLYNSYELVAGRNRLRGQFDKSLNFGGLYAEIDLIDRYTKDGEFEVLPRQIYADWFTSKYDVRVGKQNIIWGQSTGAFVNDILTPVDLREFLTQSPSDLRVGLTALNLQRYFGSNYVQFVLSPTLQPDKLPDSNSRWFPVQRPPSIIPFSFRQSDELSTISDVQLAVRFAWRPALSIDLDLMAYYWAHPMPAFSIRPRIFSIQNTPEVTLRETYRTSPMAGYSLSWQLSENWILSAEALYVNERLFTFLPVPVSRLEDALDDPVVAFQVLQEFDIRDDGYILSKPWFQQMAGIQTTLKGATIGAQGYIEVILNYEDRILPQQLFPYLSAFAQRTFFRERLSTIINGRYNIFGKDYWAQLQAAYEISDGFEFMMGTNLFGGPSISPFYGHLTFEQFKQNSFLFAQTSIYF